MKAPFVLVLALLATPVGHARAISTVTPVTPVTPVAAVAAEPTPSPWIAEYDGVEVDLRFGWDGARACQTNGLETTCYDSEAEMLAAMGTPADGSAPAPAGASGLLRASCGSYLRLYSGTSYSGSVLALTSQFVVLNLSNYGFNNITSSYRVGGCSSYFYDLSNAGAPLYGGPTSAWAESPSMLSGWDNRVSSVYIA